MKRITPFLKRRTLTISAALVGVAMLAGCSKDLDSNDYNNNAPVAGLMAANLTADKSIAVSLSGSYLTNQPLGYASYTGAYLPVYTGSRTVESRDAYNGSLLASTNITFDSAQYYSAFTIGANGAYRNVVVKDNFDSINANSSQAYVRYINAVPDSVNAATVSISANGSTVSNATINYGNISAFIPVNAGSVTFNVSKNNKVSNRTLNLEGQKAYTVLLIGNANSGNAADSTEIRYILNGTLTNDNTNGRTTNSNAVNRSVQ